MSTAEWDEIFIKRGDVYSPYISELHTLECAERRGAEAGKRHTLVKDAITILSKKEEGKSQEDDDESDDLAKLEGIMSREREGREKHSALIVAILKKEEIKSQKDDDELSKTAIPKKESGLITTNAVDWARLKIISAKLDVSPSQSISTDVQAQQLAKELVGWQSTINSFAKDEFYGVYNVKLEYGYAPVRPPKKGGDYIDTTLYGTVKTMEEHQGSSSKKDPKKPADDAKKDGN